MNNGAISVMSGSVESGGRVCDGGRVICKWNVGGRSRLRCQLGLALALSRFDFVNEF